MNRPRPDCYDKALALLGGRPHFRAELARKLARAGYAEEEVAAALARLAARGWLDDDALARQRAEQLREGQGLGRRRVAHDLLRRGVAPEAVGAALGPDGWPARAPRGGGPRRARPPPRPEGLLPACYRRGPPGDGARGGGGRRRGARSRGLTAARALRRRPGNHP